MVLALLECAVCVSLCVAAHLGLLLLVYRLVARRFSTLHKSAMGLIVLVAILGHLLEITVFAAGYALLAIPDGGSGFDEWYHSAAAYTSLGDSLPGTRELRLMTAVEALTGLVLITWTASFTFLVMQRNWGPKEAPSPSPSGPTESAEPGGVAATGPTRTSPAVRNRPTTVPGPSALCNHVPHAMENP